MEISLETGYGLPRTWLMDDTVWKPCGRSTSSVQHHPLALPTCHWAFVWEAETSLLCDGIHHEEGVYRESVVHYGWMREEEERECTEKVFEKVLCMYFRLKSGTLSYHDALLGLVSLKLLLCLSSEVGAKFLWTFWAGLGFSSNGETLAALISSSSVSPLFSNGECLPCFAQKGLDLLIVRFYSESISINIINCLLHTKFVRIIGLTHLQLGPGEWNTLHYYSVMFLSVYFWPKMINSQEQSVGNSVGKSWVLPK